MEYLKDREALNLRKMCQPLGVELNDIGKDAPPRDRKLKRVFERLGSVSILGEIAEEGMDEVLAACDETDRIAALPPKEMVEALEEHGTISSEVLADMRKDMGLSTQKVRD